MQVAIHQPEFLPWLGFFYKMALADKYVVFDHVQFKKRYFENRNRIVSPKKEISYISVPVKTKGRYTQSICDVEIDNTQRWKDKLLKKIQHFYSKAAYFKEYYEDLYSLINVKEYNYLLELNVAIISYFRRHIGISTPMVYSSEFDVDSYKGSDLILQLCILNKAKVYLCGISGRNYLNLKDFKDNNIKIQWMDYKSPAYSQLCEGFVPNMSTLDLLFNHGKNSLKILMNKT